MKKYFLVLLVCLFTVVTVHAQSLTVIVENIVYSQKGKIYVGIYKDKDSFPGEGKEYMGKQILVGKSEVAEITFDDIPKGAYGVAVFHDNNDNALLDKNFFGVPKEGYGFSNNIFGVFGPPDFEDCIFEIKSEKDYSQRIKLDY